MKEIVRSRVKLASPYYDYIREIGKDPLARKVKITDLEHNMQLGRLDVVREKDRKRFEKYRVCHEYLCNI